MANNFKPGSRAHQPHTYPQGSHMKDKKAQLSWWINSHLPFNSIMLQKHKNISVLQFSLIDLLLCSWFQILNLKRKYLNTDILKRNSFQIFIFINIDKNLFIIWQNIVTVNGIISDKHIYFISTVTINSKMSNNMTTTTYFITP